MSSSFMIPWTVACQAPLSMGFPRQEHWSRLPFSPGDLHDPGIEPVSPALQEDSLPLSNLGSPVTPIHTTDNTQKDCIKFPLTEASLRYSSHIIKDNVKKQKKRWEFWPHAQNPCTDAAFAWGWFSSVQLLSRVWLFVTPWTAAHQASLSITNSWSLLKLMSIASVMPSNHLILCHPLLLQPSIFPSFRIFSNKFDSSHQVAKVLEFQLQHQSFQWTTKTDFL